MELQGKTDIEKSVFLLREIEAFLSLNIQPPKDQMKEVKNTIANFVSHFPHCWKCGDTGFVDSLCTVKCSCTFGKD